MFDDYYQHDPIVEFGYYFSIFPYPFGGVHSKRKRAIDVSNILLFNLNSLEKWMGHVVLRMRRYE